MVIFELGSTTSNGRQIRSRHHGWHRRDPLFGPSLRFGGVQFIPYLAHYSLHRVLCISGILTSCFIDKNISETSFSMLVEILVTPVFEFQLIVSIVNRFQSHIRTDLLLFLLFDLVFKYGLIEFGKAVSLCLLLCHGRLLSNPLSVFFDQTAQIMIFASVEVFFSYFLVIWASYWKHVEFYVKWSWRTKPSKRGQLARAVLPRKQITYQNTYCTAVEV